jgi:hypothetical protein
MDTLLVFLKAPRPGAVKTRLCAALGDEAAARLYRALAEETVRRTTPRTGDYERLFCFAPADARVEMEAWFPAQKWMAQEGSDLGTRMSAAFDAAFLRGARRVAIVGSDAPSVSRETVAEALASLDEHDLALGPAGDGGYYLMALSRPRPSLFTGIAWSTASVFASTAERAGALGLSVRVLETLRDVDTLEDIRAERDRLRPLLEVDPALARAIDAALGALRR